MKRFLEKGYVILFYMLLIGLFLKGEVFRIHTNGFNFTFTSVKNLTFLFIFWCIILRLTRERKLHFSVWLCSILFIGILSVCLSSYSKASLFAGLVLLVYIGWFYSMWFILKESRYRIQMCILMISLAGVVSLADTWFHYSVGIERILEEYPFWKGKNALGLFLVMSLCISGGFLVNIKNKLYLLLIAVNTVIIMLGIVFSYSRGAWIASLVSGLGILCAKWRRIFWIVAGCIIILLLISPPLVSHRFNSIFNINELNIKERINLWSNTIQMVKENPLIGTGLGTFTQSYRDHYPGTVPEQGAGSRIIRHAHNLYLQIVAEAGALGFIMFLWLLIIGLWRGISNFLKEKSSYLRAVRYGSLLGITSFLVYSLTDCTVSWRFIGDSFSHINLIWLLFWVCVLMPVKQNHLRQS